MGGEVSRSIDHDPGCAPEATKKRQELSHLWSPRWPICCRVQRSCVPLPPPPPLPHQLNPWRSTATSQARSTPARGYPGPA